MTVGDTATVGASATAGAWGVGGTGGGETAGCAADGMTAHINNSRKIRALKPARILKLLLSIMV